MPEQVGPRLEAAAQAMRNRGVWSWERIVGPTDRALRHVAVNELGTWLVGNAGTILGSVDAGGHWVALQAMNITADFLGLRFHGTTAWVLGCGVVLQCRTS